jgi:predicted nucleotidyltransferase component of viral defense system
MDQPALDILTPLQTRVLDAVFAEEAFARAFYLTGGTALAAFYLGHRYSDDLDCFTNEPDTPFLWPMVQSLAGRLGFTVESRTAHFIRVRFGEGLRVDFVHDVAFRVGVPMRHGAWQVDSLENITLNKISAIQGRLDVKDYVDLYFLLRDRSGEILRWLEQARGKDASIDPFTWSRLIGDVETFRILPRMIKPVELRDLVAFYRALRQSILAHLKP